MVLKIFIALFIEFGPCASDQISDIAYLSTDFANDGLKTASHVFVWLPMAIIYFLSCYPMKEMKKDDPRACVVSLGYMTGFIPMAVYFRLYMPLFAIHQWWSDYNNYEKDNSFLCWDIDKLRRTITIHEIIQLCVSIAQVIIQSNNNSLMSQWNTLEIVSMTFSIFNIVKTSIEFIY